MESLNQSIQQEEPEMRIRLQPAKKEDKKYQVRVQGKIISFGQVGASDYTQHGDKKRKKNYVNRHISERDKGLWNKDNIDTAAFWSRHLLWGTDDIFKSIQKIENNYGVQIEFSKLQIERQQKKLAELISQNEEKKE